MKKIMWLSSRTKSWLTGCGSVRKLDHDKKNLQTENRRSFGKLGNKTNRQQIEGFLVSWFTTRIADKRVVFWLVRLQQESPTDRWPLGKLGHDKNRRQREGLLVSWVTTRIADKEKVFW
jgi:hypothetical protein